MKKHNKKEVLEILYKIIKGDCILNNIQSFQGVMLNEDSEGNDLYYGLTKEEEEVLMDLVHDIEFYSGHSNDNFVININTKEGLDSLNCLILGVLNKLK